MYYWYGYCYFCLEGINCVVLEVQLSGQDSDVDSSHSVCSGSDTHSGHTSLSGTTDKGSLSGPSVQVSIPTEAINTNLYSKTISPGNHSLSINLIDEKYAFFRNRHKICEQLKLI